MPTIINTQKTNITFILTKQKSIGRRCGDHSKFKAVLQRNHHTNGKVTAVSIIWWLLMTPSCSYTVNYFNSIRQLIWGQFYKKFYNSGQIKKLIGKCENMLWFRKYLVRTLGHNLLEFLKYCVFLKVVAAI
jgi:hypothetical protein